MGESRQQEAIASGPFSAGQVSKETQQLNRRHGHRGSGWKGFKPRSTKEAEEANEGRPGRSSTAKGSQNNEPEESTSTSTREKWTIDQAIADDGYDSTEDDEIRGQRRMDIEKLGVIDLTQDDDDFESMAPIRLKRVPHKEFNLNIKSERGIKKEPGTENDRAEAKKKAPEAKVKSKENDIHDKIAFQGVYSDSESDSKPHVQPEGEASASEKQTNDIIPDEPPSSPETRRKGKQKIKIEDPSEEALPEEEYDEETQMDREEQARRKHDLDIVRTEFGQGEDKDGDATMLDADGAEQRANKVYLFQFPPGLPDLEPIVVKPDPDAPNGDLMQLDPPSNESKPITIKDEPQLPRLPSGAVGKMKVHASGKVTLDWGGMSLCLGAGGKADFLQCVFAATFPDQKIDQKEGSAGSAEVEEGQAVNLGRVRGKMVVTPDWEEMLG